YPHPQAQRQKVQREKDRERQYQLSFFAHGGNAPSYGIFHSFRVFAAVYARKMLSWTEIFAILMPLRLFLP
ncbi:MAG: hypothetical protein IJ617_04680, partial [Oscillospiraceae bacterium]|nr:hypothetical protein [Oscillospiraceae bacterium]